MRNLDQLHNEAPILKHTVDFYKELYQHLKTFPKKDQYMLGKRCEEYILAFMEFVFVAASSGKERKFEMLDKASQKLDVLKILLRMARELKMLDNKKYLSLEERIQEIGRMLGGWMRSLQ